MVKLTDVARAAGVGYGTASRALSGKGPVGGDARTRVLEAEFYTASAEVLQDALRAAGHHLFVATTGNHPGATRKHCRRWQPAGWTASSMYLPGQRPPAPLPFRWWS